MEGIPEEDENGNPILPDAKKQKTDAMGLFSPLIIPPGAASLLAPSSAPVPPPGVAPFVPAPPMAPMGYPYPMPVPPNMGGPMHGAWMPPMPGAAPWMPPVPGANPLSPSVSNNPLAPVFGVHGLQPGMIPRKFPNRDHSNIGLAIPNASVTSAQPAAPPEYVLIYEDEVYSMEEKRAQLPKYRYDEDKIKEQVNKLDSTIESRLSNIKSLAY